MACAEHADDPQPSWCAECMETMPGAPEPPRWARAGRAFPSRFPGTCRSCGRRYEAGRQVQRWDRGDQETVYVPTECGAPA